MAACEQQPEQVVLPRANDLRLANRDSHPWAHLGEQLERLACELLPRRATRPIAVGIARDREQPRFGRIGTASRGPRLERADDRLLDGVLGVRQIARERQRLGEHVSIRASQDVGNRFAHLFHRQVTGRTSIA
jgi:hypothetical protein